MAKITWKPGTMEYPLPPAMISCGTVEKPNIMTAAWTGIISSEPPMTYVSIRPSRYSHELIKESGEFVINLTTLSLVTAADFCGVKSGRDINKFKEMKLTPGKCSQISAPQIVESPVSIECKVKSITNYGSHDMFLAEIVAVNVDDRFIDENGKLWLEKAGLIAYSHNYYYTLGRNVGFFGFSVCRSAMKAKEKMKNVIVEIKEPKIIKAESDKKQKFATTHSPWGKKASQPSRERKKFDGKDKFERSRRSEKNEDNSSKKNSHSNGSKKRLSEGRAGSGFIRGNHSEKSKSFNKK